MDPVMVLVPKIVSGLELVPEMMMESMTMSELERTPEGFLFPENVYEMETSHQEKMLKLGLQPVSV